MHQLGSGSTSGLVAHTRNSRAFWPDLRKRARRINRILSIHVDRTRLKVTGPLDNRHMLPRFPCVTSQGIAGCREQWHLKICMPGWHGSLSSDEPRIAEVLDLVRFSTRCAATYD